MRNRKAKARQISHILLAVLVGSVLFLALSPVFGIRFDVVLSGSMSPSLNTGDLVLVTEAPPIDLKEGDVIVFDSPLGTGLVCHRIVAVGQGSDITFQTKGDSNEDPDPFLVPSASVMGKVQVVVPWMGYVVQYLRGPFGPLLIMALILATMLIPEKETIKQRSSKENGDAEPAAQDKG